MFKGFSKAFIFVVIAVALTGCGIGKNKVLFVTKSNVGLDVDSTPPTAELTIARRELAIPPTFEGAETLPLIATFRNEGGFSRNQSVFAGGEAAHILAKLWTSANETLGGQDGYKPSCLSGAPTDTDLPGEGSVMPFYFATDTAIGLKLGWSGATSVYPSRLQFGYNRKEFAFASVFGQPATCTTKSGKSGTYQADIPAFIATIDQGVKVGGPQDTKSEYRQYFATGSAATELAKKVEIRRVLVAQIDPAARMRTVSYDPDETSELIDCWVLNDDPSKSQDRADKVHEWLAAQPDIPSGTDYPAFTADKKLSAQRRRFVAEEGVQCSTN